MSPRDRSRATMSPRALASAHGCGVPHLPYDARNMRTPAAACRRSSAGFGIASSPNSMALFKGSPIINQLNWEAADLANHRAAQLHDARREHNGKLHAKVSGQTDTFGKRVKSVIYSGE